MENYYWTQKEEDLCVKWLTATEVEKSKIYKELLPRMNQMAEYILNKYYSPPYHMQLDLKKDAVQEAFIRLNGFNPKRSKAYSFCGMILKHYYHDMLVFSPNLTRNKNVNLEFTDNEAYLDYQRGIEYENSYKEYDTDKVIRWMENKKRSLRQEMQNTIKKYKKRKLPKDAPIKKYVKYIMILDTCIQFIERYNSIHVTTMADYCVNNTKEKLSQKQVTYAFKAIFDVNAYLGRNDVQGTVDAKYNWFIDDITPDKNLAYTRKYKKDFAKKLNYDFEKYSFL